MDLTNDSYQILIGTKSFTERYYRDKDGWLKVSARGRKFRATAEQVLNHVLPAVAGLKPNVTIRVVHKEKAKTGSPVTGRSRLRPGSSPRGGSEGRSRPAPNRRGSGRAPR